MSNPAKHKIQKTLQTVPPAHALQHTVSGPSCPESLLSFYSLLPAGAKPETPPLSPHLFEALVGPRPGGDVHVYEVANNRLASQGPQPVLLLQGVAAQDGLQ